MDALAYLMWQSSDLSMRLQRYPSGVCVTQTDPSSQSFRAARSWQTASRCCLVSAPLQRRKQALDYWNNRRCLCWSCDFNHEISKKRRKILRFVWSCCERLVGAMTPYVVVDSQRLALITRTFLLWGKTLEKSHVKDAAIKTCCNFVVEPGVVWRG